MKKILVLPLNYIMNFIIFHMLNSCLNYWNMWLTYFFSFYLTVCTEQQELPFNKDVNQSMSLLCSKWVSDSTAVSDTRISNKHHCHLNDNGKADTTLKCFLESVIQYLLFYMESSTFNNKIWNSWKIKKSTTHRHSNQHDESLWKNLQKSLL